MPRPLTARSSRARRLALLLLLLASPAQAASFATAPLAIDTPRGARDFTVELARTPYQQELGLMFRKSLAPDAGMLFVFHRVQIAEFWMKNTYIPLDMLFIAPDGRIADMHQDATPLSEAVIASRVPVKAVLELAGGTVARLGIRDGDRVHAAAFGDALHP